MKPILRPISPFDARRGTTVTFSWTGAQQKSNRLVIRDSKNNSIVYDAVHESFKGEHIIPPNSGLENGKSYMAVVYVTDMSGYVSDTSSPILLKCFSQPTFVISNISNDQIITNSNLLVELTYSQPENEPLDSWQIYLYNKSQSLIYSTGLRYKVEAEDLKTTLSGLLDRTEYYIRAVGTTVNGFLMDTGFIHITVTIEVKKVFTNLELTNRPDLGSILVKANVISVDAKSCNGEPIFIDGEYIDLRNNCVCFDKGFIIENDFSLFLVLYGLTPNKELLRMSHADKGIYINTRSGVYSDTNGLKVMQLELRSIGTPMQYVLYSNYINYPDEADILSIKLEKINNQYNIELKNITKEVTQT